MAVRHFHQHSIYAGLSQTQVYNQLPPMLLTLTCAAKIADGHLTASHGEVFGDFPAYQYLNTVLDGYDNEKKSVRSLSITAHARWKLIK